MNKYYCKKDHLLFILVETTHPITSFLSSLHLEKCRRATLDTPSALKAFLSGRRMAVPRRKRNKVGFFVAQVEFFGE